MSVVIDGTTGISYSDTATLTLGSSSVNTYINSIGITTGTIFQPNTTPQPANVFTYSATTTNTYITVANAVTSVGNSYCLEWFINFPTPLSNGATGYQNILTSASATGLVISAANNGVFVGEKSYTSEYPGGFSLLSNTWYHMAYIGTGSQTFFYVNGVPATWYTGNTYLTPTASPTHGSIGGGGGATQNGALFGPTNSVGLQFFGGGTPGSFTIYNFRVTTNTTVYSTSGFTPPTSALTSTVNNGVVQALLFTSNTFTDAGPYSLAVTGSNTASITTANGPMYYGLTTMGQLSVNSVSVVVANGGTFVVGNSSTNASINNTTMFVGNNTTNTVVNATGIYLNGVGYIQNGITLGNVTTNTSANAVISLTPSGYFSNVWTTGTAVAANIANISYGNGIFLATVATSNASFYSTNGSIWVAGATIANAAGTTITNRIPIYGYAVNRFVLPQGNTSTLYLNANTVGAGNNWSVATAPGSIISVAYGNGRYVGITSAYSTGVTTSLDGINWTALQLLSTDTHGNALQFIMFAPDFQGGKFIINTSTASSTGKSFYTSSDGIIWTLYNETLSAALYASSLNSPLTYGNGIFFACGTNLVFTSPDLVTWTSGTAATGQIIALGYFGGYHLFRNSGTPQIYGVSSVATSITTIYASPGLLPSAMAASSNTIVLMESGASGNNKTTFNFGSILEYPQQLGYIDNIIIGDTNSRRATFTDLYAQTSLTVGGGISLISNTITIGANGTITIGGNGTSGIGGFGANSTIIYVGNNTANTTGTGGFSANSLSMFLGNNTVNAVHSTSLISINPTAAANTTGTGGLYATGTTLFFGNTFSSHITNTTTMFIGNSVINATINTSSLIIGNSSVNATIGPTLLTINPTASANTTGTGGLYATGISLYMGNTTSTTLITPTSITIGNSVANTSSGTGGLYATGSTLSLGNTRGFAELSATTQSMNIYSNNGLAQTFYATPSSLTIGNTTQSYLSLNPVTGLILSNTIGNTTGFGGASYTPLSLFIGNNTINTTLNSSSLSINTSPGYGLKYVSNTSGMFLGNDAINTAISLYSISISPTISANSTGLGGFYASNSGISFGNGTIYGTQNTGYLILNPTASANTTGSGGAWIGGQQAAMFLGNTATYVSLSPTNFTMGQTSGGASIFYTGISPSNTTGSGALQFNSTGGGPVLFAGNNTGNLYWNGTYSSEGSTLFVGTATGTGTGGGKVNTSTFFAGNNTVNAIISYNASLGIQINPVAAAITTGTGGFIANTTMMLIGNTSINAVHNTSAITINPTADARNTGSGGLFANASTLFLGNAASNTTVNTTVITIGGPLANTTGTGGFYGTGNQLFIGNTAANISVNTTAILFGGGTATTTGTGGIRVGGGGGTQSGAVLIGNNVINAYFDVVQWYLNPTSDARNTGSGGLIANGYYLSIGNTGGNVQMSATPAPTLTISGTGSGLGGGVHNGSVMYVGNSTVNGYHSTSQIYINPTSDSRNTGSGGALINSIALFVGNATSNAFVNAGSSIGLNGGTGLTSGTGGFTVDTTAIYYGNTASKFQANGSSIRIFRGGATSNVTAIFMAPVSGGSSEVGPIFTLGFDGGSNGPGGATLWFPQGQGAFAIASNVYSVNTSAIQLGNSSTYMNFWSAGTNAANNPFIQAVGFSNASGPGGFNVNAYAVQFGNGTVNGWINSTSLAINPIAAANTTGTGGVYASATGFFAGNSTISALQNTSTISIIPTALANTTGSGGFNATGTSIYIGNTGANSSLTTTTLTLGGGTATTTGLGGSTVNTLAHFVGNNTVNATMNTAGIYIGGKVTAAATGYTVLPNGIKMNWGSISANSLGVVGTFSSAFTTLYNVTISSTAIAVIVAATASNTTTVTATTNSAASTTVYYHAIGV